jgi:hypothetical protein
MTIRRAVLDCDTPVRQVDADANTVMSASANRLPSER